MTVPFSNLALFSVYEHRNTYVRHLIKETTAEKFLNQFKFVDNFMYRHV